MKRGGDKKFKMKYYDDVSRECWEVFKQKLKGEIIYKGYQLLTIPGGSFH
jgi:hypothetical protein